MVLTLNQCHRRCQSTGEEGGQREHGTYPNEGAPLAHAPPHTNPMRGGGSNVWPDLVMRERRAHLNNTMSPTRICKVPLPIKPESKVIQKKRQQDVQNHTV